MRLSWINRKVPSNWITIPWCLAGFAAILVFGSQLSWSSWYPPKFAVGLTLTVFFAYLAAFFFSNQLISFPIRKPTLLFILIVVTTHIAAIAVPATFRFYYSRTFIFVSFLFALSWIVIGHLIVSRERAKKRIGLVPTDYSESLSEIPGYQWVAISESRLLEAGDLDVISADLHAKLKDDWKRFLASASVSGIPVIDSAILYESLTGRVSLAHLANSSIDEVSTQYPSYLPIKRFLDISFVVIFSPIIFAVIGIIALAIRVEGAGSTIFVQERIGFRNRVFKLYKFRSMAAFPNNNKSQFTGKDDQRITRVGRLLRKHRLDELPQLLNVLNGTMSLIGPRPEQQDFVEEYSRTIGFYPYRHSVKPGITGWAQVSQGYTSSEESTRKKLEHDFYYIKNVSPWLDLLILIKTFNTILGGYGSRY